MSTIKIPRKKIAAWLGPKGEHWKQNEWGDDTNGCLHQAIRQCCPVLGDAALIQEVAKRKGWGVDWNDADVRTWSDIAALLNSPGFGVTDQDMVDTFGPQWPEIVALVRRISTLTADEADQLDAARWAIASGASAKRVASNAARNAAWNATQDAASNAASNAAWNAAWNAANKAARDAAPTGAGSVATTAAAALTVRDLISEHGFTQAHYDTLTGPWRKVIGRVHPDDEETT